MTGGRTGGRAARGTGIGAPGRGEPGMDEMLAPEQLPYQHELRVSQTRNMARMREPKTVASWVRWVRWAYKQEPPLRLHVHSLGQDGNPQMSGDFLAWIASIDDFSIACGTDTDGYYRTPLRCAMFTLHGRFEDTDRANKADFALALAQSDEAYDRVAQLCGLPHWVAEVATIDALRSVWDLYTPLPRG